MEGGLDVEAHAAQEEEPKQTSGAAETEEGNKFQKAIGAWRSMVMYLYSILGNAHKVQISI
jgi:homeobox protein cut-like